MVAVVATTLDTTSSSPENKETISPATSTTDEVEDCSITLTDVIHSKSNIDISDSLFPRKQPIASPASTPTSVLSKPATPSDAPETKSLDDISTDSESGESEEEIVELSEKSVLRKWKKDINSISWRWTWLQIQTNELQQKLKGLNTHENVNGVRKVAKDTKPTLTSVLYHPLFSFSVVNGSLKKRSTTISRPASIRPPIAHKSIGGSFFERNTTSANSNSPYYAQLLALNSANFIKKIHPTMVKQPPVVCSLKKRRRLALLAKSVPEVVENESVEKEEKEKEHKKKKEDKIDKKKADLIISPKKKKKDKHKDKQKDKNKEKEKQRDKEREKKKEKEREKAEREERDKHRDNKEKEREKKKEKKDKHKDKKKSSIISKSSSLSTSSKKAPMSKLTKDSLQPQKKKALRTADYDINNIVIPFSMGSSPQITIVKARDINTPTWRLADEVPDPEESSGEEDTSDEMYAHRHSCESAKEKIRYAKLEKKLRKSNSASSSDVFMQDNFFVTNAENDKDFLTSSMPSVSSEQSSEQRKENGKGKGKGNLRASCPSVITTKKKRKRQALTLKKKHKKKKLAESTDDVTYVYVRELRPEYEGSWQIETIPKCDDQCDQPNSPTEDVGQERSPIPTLPTTSSDPNNTAPMEEVPAAVSPRGNTLTPNTSTPTTTSNSPTNPDKLILKFKRVSFQTSAQNSAQNSGQTTPGTTTPVLTPVQTPIYKSISPPSIEATTIPTTTPIVTPTAESTSTLAESSVQT